MILNNNGQAITLAKEFAEVGYGDLTKAKGLLEPPHRRPSWR